MKGWRFWPEREPGPVDDDFVQVRWMRPYRPGPWRVAVCLLLMLVFVYLLMAGLLAALSSAGIPELAVRVLLTGVVLLVVLTVGTRCFLAGVWVTDHGIRIVRPLSSRAWRWTEVADARSVPMPSRLLGSVVRTDGDTLVLVLADGSDVETPVTSRSLDFLGRAEAYDMAADAVEGWLEQFRRRDKRR